MTILAVLFSFCSTFGLFGPSSIFAAPPVIDTFETPLRAGSAGGIPIGFNTFQDPNSSVAISLTSTPPSPVPGSIDPNSVLRLDLSVVAFAGFTHSFENDTLDQWVSQDWSAYEGISFWMYGNNSGTTMFVDVLDNRNDPVRTNDDAERWSVTFIDNFSGWQELRFPFATMARKEIGNGAPNDGFGLTNVHGWAVGTITTPSAQSYYIDNVTLYGVAPIRPLTVGFSAINYSVTEGTPATVTVKLSKPSSDPVTVAYSTTFGPAIANRDYTPVQGMLTFAPNVTQQSFVVPTFDNAKYQGERGVQLNLSNPTGGAALGLPPVARVTIRDNESFDPALLDDFESTPYLWDAADGPNGTQLRSVEIAAGAPDALPGQGAYERVLRASRAGTRNSMTFGRVFPIPQDWSGANGLSFWYYGRNTGKQVQVGLENDPSRTSSPADWQLVWSDEFNGRRGSPPNPEVWGHEVGDGVAIGNPGWGNDELQYYTNSTNNAAMDGHGNLVITARADDGNRMCYYGPCKFTSARLLSKDRFEVAYGRVEARIKVPQGAGLWPAFWMLGTDIDEVNWPQTGEIDIMEFVGRLPNEVFGTIHGPGYSGGQSYGRTYTFPGPVYNDYHTFTVEWEPNKIVWYVDGIQYHQATPNDAFLQGKPWVYNHPFFMLLNVAVGGNFGGTVGADTVFPQSMKVDYVRLYQGKPKPVGFKAFFADNFNGWRKIDVPLSSFSGKPGTTLDRTAVTALYFETQAGQRGLALIDQIRLTCADTITVTSIADSGAGSLRSALANVCVGGTIQFAPSLAGQTISLTSGPITLSKAVTIDGSAASGLSINGNATYRLIEVNAGTTATVRGLTLTNGYGFQLAGGVLNNGNLTLDRVNLSNNTMATNAGDFWQGGGGVYSGDGASLMVIDSTIANNNARWSGGGIYAFFNTTTTIIRSTISGNTSGDVGGGIRSLGNVTITNSTISGNTSTGWHGGAIFHTDGIMSIESSTIANNAGPDFAPSAIFIGSFNANVPSLTLTNTLITGNRWYACEWRAAGTVQLTSSGNNLVQDGSCNPVAGDIITTNQQIDPLANNGGPTQTHALIAGSQAINAAGAGPATDQRGITRGASRDIGSYEAP
jgi:beta-glucanase (GH16 family)